MIHVMHKCRDRVRRDGDGSDGLFHGLGFIVLLWNMWGTEHRQSWGSKAGEESVEDGKTTNLPAVSLMASLHFTDAPLTVHSSKVMTSGLLTPNVTDTPDGGLALIFGIVAVFLMLAAFIIACAIFLPAKPQIKVAVQQNLEKVASWGSGEGSLAHIRSIIGGSFAHGGSHPSIEHMPLQEFQHDDEDDDDDDDNDRGLQFKI
uniref:uncharacterized protein n=1 Tax=Myxine glutinosa TaxID=7769 RepID=UPI00358EBAA2